MGFPSPSTPTTNPKGSLKVLQMKVLKQDAIYLSTPLFLSRAPSKDFKFIQDQLEAQLTGWRSKCLSWAGKCTLINLVA